MGTQVVILVGTFVLIVTGLLLGYVLSQLVLQNLAFNFLTLLGTISLILIFGTLYYVLFWQLRREPLQAIKPSIPNQVDEEVTGNYLKNRLIARLSGDVAAAERLIEQAKQSVPGMPENWYCEKVLNELDQDHQ
ncbi:ABC transporter permease [Dolichospermum sp. ST_sed1]|nr:ABC transporter permease [Dolichospermum sp. ST_sed1]MDD1425377.1 ABC transporter permease [Dolichospermum sp. ST_sed9]MDD1430859.1 ABC transporter permease [Dolichospermum sp. ST_sed6]MDD1442458.1 ABC transporter permease [Dolichospermum sp. ST_sed3]MDD1446073.1 ABC transporter permease [Dolichospermum sp. ST_sed8]MDD1454273.1 ABC transporter permease [Dolichospermum sp. ST_sed7]MDD1462229.1 ABC transporter permease [Dolichospermum sp. ST_sed2]MDD1469360.1 ABC transporter permease [Dolic